MMSFRWSAVKPYRQCPGCYAVCIPYQFECPRCEHHPFRAKYSDSHSGEGAHMIHHLAVARFLMFAIMDCGVRSLSSSWTVEFSTFEIPVFITISFQNV